MQFSDSEACKESVMIPAWPDLIAVEIRRIHTVCQGSNVLRWCMLSELLKMMSACCIVDVRTVCICCVMYAASKHALEARRIWAGCRLT